MPLSDRLRHADTTVSACASMRLTLPDCPVLSQNTSTLRVMGSAGSRTISRSNFPLSFQWICRILSPGTYSRIWNVSVRSAPGRS